MLSVTSCATNSSVNEYCLIASPPVYTERDVDVISDELARWLNDHYDKYIELCLKGE